MCDYSLQHAKSRPAVKGERLTIRDFGRGTKGFCGTDDFNSTLDNTAAVCVLPGTEIAFDKPVTYTEFKDWAYSEPKTTTATARFRQINKGEAMAHHDALEFADGEFVLLTRLDAGLTATVLQMPATPKTADEAKAQERLPMAEGVSPVAGWNHIPADVLG